MLAFVQSTFTIFPCVYACAMKHVCKRIFHTEYIHNNVPPPRVNFLMFNGVLEVGKGISRLATYVRFFPCVDSLMCN